MLVAIFAVAKAVTVIQKIGGRAVGRVVVQDMFPAHSVMVMDILSIDEDKNVMAPIYLMVKRPVVSIELTWRTIKSSGKYELQEYTGFNIFRYALHHKYRIVEHLQHSVMPQLIVQLTPIPKKYIVAYADTVKDAEEAWKYLNSR